MRTYKALRPSGVSWVGAIPAHWEMQRVRFRCRLNPRIRPDLDDEQDVSFLPMEAIGDDGSINIDATRKVKEVASGYTCFEDADVTIAKITPCFENGKGAVMKGLLGGIGFGTTELIVIRPESAVDSNWLYYLTQSEPFRRIGEAMMYGAGGQKRVPDSYVKDLPVAWPPRHEQQAIADYLDTETSRIAALISEKELLIETLHEFGRSTFVSTLLEAAADGAEANPHIEWLPAIPANWTCCKVKHLIESFDQGISPQCEPRPPEGDEWGVLKVGCVNSGRFDPMESKTLPPEIQPIEEITLQDGDVMISRANTRSLVGRCAAADKAYPRLMLSDKLYRLRIDRQRCEPAFLVDIIALPAVRQRIEERATGASASMLNIDRRTILELDIVLPPLDVQRSIVRQTHSERHGVFELIDYVTHEIVLLRELRSTTISDAVLGRIKVC